MSKTQNAPAPALFAAVTPGGALIDAAATLRNIAATVETVPVVWLNPYVMVEPVHVVPDGTVINGVTVEDGGALVIPAVGEREDMTIVVDGLDTAKEFLRAALRTVNQGISARDAAARRAEARAKKTGA